MVRAVAGWGDVEELYLRHSRAVYRRARQLLGEDEGAHDATQDASRFGTGTISAGATSTPLAMSTAGTFTYHCTIHPGMVGTLVVQ